VRGLFSFLVIFSIFVNGSVSAQEIAEINVIGNRTTKLKIIFRELTFIVGDNILPKDTAKHITNSENNLFNTSLFNFTTVNFKDTLGKWYVEVELQERWYLWPEVIIKFQDRNFSEWQKNKDLSRIDAGVHLNKFNFLGLNQTLQISGYLGFTEKFGFKYKVPYINKKLKDGLKIASNYSTRNEIFTGVRNNEMIYLKNDSTSLYSRFNFQFEYFRRKGFYQNQYFNAEFVQIKTQNELSNLNNHYLGQSDNLLRYVFLSYRYKLDKRFSQNYPLRGFFFDVQLKQFGLNKIDNSNLSVTHIQSNYRYYTQIKNRLFWASGIHIGQFMQNNVPFIFKNGLGFSNYVRGYEPYVIMGKTSSLIKNNFKIQLLKPKSYIIPFIKNIKKFSKIHFALYLNTYIDAGYVFDNNQLTNDLINNFLIGGGTGLDWITYYDVVIRTEYSANKMGEYNFNISFVAPI